VQYRHTLVIGSGAAGLNAAVQVRKNGFAAEALEIAVCAQHNNGGLAGNIWWESTNAKHLFAVGEVNGSHGVARPGGSALNAGSVGGFRAAEFIANRYAHWTLDTEAIKSVAGKKGELSQKSTPGLKLPGPHSKRARYTQPNKSF